MVSSKQVAAARIYRPATSPSRPGTAARRMAPISIPFAAQRRCTLLLLRPPRRGPNQCTPWGGDVALVTPATGVPAPVGTRGARLTATAVVARCCEGGCRAEAGTAPRCEHLKICRVCDFVRDTPTLAYETAHSTNSSARRGRRPGLLRNCRAEAGTAPRRHQRRLSCVARQRSYDLSRRVQVLPADRWPSRLDGTFTSFVSSAGCSYLKPLILNQVSATDRGTPDGPHLNSLCGPKTLHAAISEVATRPWGGRRRRGRPRVGHNAD